MKKMWVVYGNTESSDKIEPILFSTEPSDEILKQIAMDADGLTSEDELDGPGDFGTYAFLTKKEIEIE